uniref:Uncharacterized protein n=1 Tax=Panagrolaimus superbus TaxID=310955 RepID=A0A914YVT1_9BILA
MSDVCRQYLPYWPYAAIPIGVYGLSQLLSWLIPGPKRQSSLNLKDKTVLITGASTGLGRSLAFEFYKRVSLRCKGYCNRSKLG